MAANDELMDNPIKHQVLITRIFDAPRELVFRMWTQPEYVARWWGPKDFTNSLCEMDVRVGGAIKILMQAPDGIQIPVMGVFQEIREPERIVFLTMKMDGNGRSELEVLNTVTFTEENGKTKLVLKAVVTKATPEAVASIQGMETGWNQSLDRLAEVLH